MNLDQFASISYPTLWRAGEAINRPFETSSTEAVTAESAAAQAALMERAAEQSVVARLNRAWPDIPMLRKSDSRDIDSGSRYLFFLNAIDGPESLIMGAVTSTVSLSLYDQQAEATVAEAVLDPRNDRFWYAIQGQGCVRQTSYEPKHLCRVTQAQVGRFPTVMIDSFRAHRRNRRPMLTSKGCVRLFESLQHVVDLKSYGSNSLHHILVADGRPGAFGAITTAVDGPWDLGGALAVHEAGGQVMAFTLDSNRRLVECPPLDIVRADFMIVANSLDTLALLESALHTAITRLH